MVRKLKKLFVMISIVMVAALVLYRKPLLQFIDKTVWGSNTIDVEAAFYVQKLYSSYGDQVDILAEFDLPADYLKALIVLESSGKRRLRVALKNMSFIAFKRYVRGSEKYENVTQTILHDATDGALRNLASSWGPFQLMGYKCILLNINVADVRGEKALYWGVKWIDMTYGDYLRKGE